MNTTFAMLTVGHTLGQTVGWGLLAAATVYAILSALALRLWERRRDPRAPADVAAHPVTVLKPLCGAEPRLYENLRSFCAQDHPRYQIVFGTREADDPALDVARRLQTEFPQLDIVVVSDPRVHGRNLKVSNLLNLLPHARHDWLVIADSDISVSPDYLRCVTAPLARADVGLVTCLYRGRALGGVWSRLGTLFIDDWFRPSVQLAHMLGYETFGFGATLALRRDALAAIGGFEALTSHLADDFQLGALTHSRGLATVLSHCEVATDVAEARAGDLFAHELRWLRTIRIVQPLGYSFMFVSFTVPVALGGWMLAGAGLAASAVLALAGIARIILHRRRPASQNLFADFGLLCLRDTLSLGLWAAAFLGQRVSWRGQQMTAHATRYTASS